MNFQAKIGDEWIHFELIRQKNNIQLIQNNRSENLDIVHLSPFICSVIVRGKSITLTFSEHPEGYHVMVGKHSFLIQIKDESDILLEKYGLGKKENLIKGEVKAPIPGFVSHIYVYEGQSVKKGDKLLILEAMKMENELDSPLSGVVKRIYIKKGVSVEKDTLLLTLVED